MPGVSGDEIMVLTGATTRIGRAAALVIADRAGRLFRHGLDREPDIGDLPGTVRTRMRLESEPDHLSAHDSDLTVDIVARHPGAISTRLPHAIFSLAGGPPEGRRPTSGTSPRARTTTAPATTNVASTWSASPTTPGAAQIAGVHLTTQDRLPDITSRILRDHLDPMSTSRR